MTVFVTGSSHSLLPSPHPPAVWRVPGARLPGQGTHSSEFGVSFSTFPRILRRCFKSGFAETVRIPATGAWGTAFSCSHETEAVLRSWGCPAFLQTPVQVTLVAPVVTSPCLGCPHVVKQGLHAPAGTGLAGPSLPASLAARAQPWPRAPSVRGAHPHTGLELGAPRLWEPGQF